MIEICTTQQKQMVLDYLFQRFGLDADLFNDYGFYVSQNEKVYIAPINAPKELNIDSAGLMIARIKGLMKPTTNLFHSFGNHVSKNVISIDREQTVRYARGEEIVLEEKDTKDITNGFVLIRYGNHNLACGLLVTGTLKNMVPSEKKIELKYL